MMTMNLAAISWQGELQALQAMVVFGAVGIGLMMLGFKAFDWITPKIDIQKELAEHHNLAVAIVVAAVMLGVAAIALTAMV